MLDNLAFDQAHILHPYSKLNSTVPLFEVSSAKGVYIHLKDGRKLIDGMASWWSVIHGYNHPALNDAIAHQTSQMAHVMFGGLTHEPAVALARKLVQLTPDALQSVFFSDSGSIAVEVAMKMAIQYWHAKQQPKKQRFISLSHGYHGDTFGAMSVSDPKNGMHSLFSQALIDQIHVSAPPQRTDVEHDFKLEQALNDLEKHLQEHRHTLAGFILEPIVQGAGGMRFYSAKYLKKAKILCEQYNVLFIADEIATGFGRTGELFACNHAHICPDIMCLGKALTGGYTTMGVTLSTHEIAHSIAQVSPNVFMHGPTFMANPNACAVALQSIQLLEDMNIKTVIHSLEKHLKHYLSPCSTLDSVREVRVLGGIGVVEMKESVDMPTLQQKLVDQGVWVRPFGKLVYIMPPYIITQDQIRTLCTGIYRALCAD